MDNLDTKIAHATKWASFAEIAARFVLPISNMILARLLTPEAFGVVATVTIVITFANVFQDAGFQKYIIQHEFASEADYDNGANVAFWTNLALSIVLWAIIVAFRNPIASLIGDANIGTAVAIASFSLPIFAFSSIQTAHYRRNFAYKKLFWVRMITSFIPLALTVPLAYILKSYWALIIGTIARGLAETIALYIGSSWKPKLFYSLKILKEMFSFCIWTLFESISIWLTGNAGVFIVSSFFGTEMVGFYKTSISTVTSVIGIVSAATLTVLFSALSRLQNDDNRFKTVFYNYQKTVAMLVIPIGMGIWLFNDLFVRILLGPKWEYCSSFIGMFALAMAISIPTSSFFSELYRAKGKPRISMLAQVIYLGFLIPTIAVASKYGFTAVAITTTVDMYLFMIVHLIIVKVYFKLKINVMLKNITAVLAVSGMMAAVAALLKSISQNFALELVSIVICSAVYIGLLIAIKPLRETLKTSELTAGAYAKVSSLFKARK
jgi:O-antigen/teichoic acid export membrane protein